MPTTTKLYTPVEQQEGKELLRKMLHTTEVWECTTPAGEFSLTASPAGYQLRGEGVRLFGIEVPFGDPIPIHATDDGDAIRSVQRLILDRWVEEERAMRAAFSHTSEGVT